MSAVCGVSCLPNMLVLRANAQVVRIDVSEVTIPVEVPALCVLYLWKPGRNQTDWGNLTKQTEMGILYFIFILVLGIKQGGCGDLQM